MVFLSVEKNKVQSCKRRESISFSIYFSVDIFFWVFKKKDSVGKRVRIRCKGTNVIKSWCEGADATVYSKDYGLRIANVKAYWLPAQAQAQAVSLSLFLYAERL